MSLARNGLKRKRPSATAERPAARGIAKAQSGIAGLDEITGGGLPRGRPTLVCGGPGSGKTLLAMQFIVEGATRFGEPGVFVAFEETAEELTANVRSLGFDLDELTEQNKVAVDYVHIERGEIEETGEYDLEGLFLRIGWAIDSVGAKRIALDTIENVFAGFSNPAVLRSELRRLFRWLKEKGVTAVITGERGDGPLTRQGLEEYVSDCVILLDHRVAEQVATRRLRIVKYRGTSHGTNEYPFLIDERGFEVLPVTALSLDHPASEERISSGVEQLDVMLGGKGFFRGSTVLVSGTAGSGKTSLAASFVRAAGARGERCLYFAFEESPAQIVRNMRSIGLDLRPLVDRGVLRFHATRPTLCGLESHLSSIQREIRTFEPAVVIVDPVTNLGAVGSISDVSAMLLRLVDWLKSMDITALFTTLTKGGDALEQTEVGVSSVVDTWLLVRALESNGERNRGLYVLKSRGMAHSNQIREFLLTDRGIALVDVFLGTGGVVTGSARAAQEAQEQAAEEAIEAELDSRRLELDGRRKAVEAQIEALRAELAAHESEMRRLHRAEEDRKRQRSATRERLAALRGADRGRIEGSARRHGRKAAR